MQLMLMLLAEAAPIGIADFSPALSTVGSLGICGWHVFYTTTVTIPKMQADHMAERQAMQDRFDTQLSDQRTEFLKLLDSQRTDFNNDVQSILSEMKEQRAQHPRRTFKDQG